MHLVKIWEERGGTPADDFNLELSSEDIKNLRDTIVEGKLPIAFDPAHYECEVKNRAAQESVFLDAVDTMLRAINDGHYVYYTRLKQAIKVRKNLLFATTQRVNIDKRRRGSPQGRSNMLICISAKSVRNDTIWAKSA